MRGVSHWLHVAARLAIAGGALLARCHSALALDPSLDVTQYAHKAWKIREGFPNDIVQSFAQTTDGYLWLGTLSGLLRFDGVRSTKWQPPPGEHLPNNSVRALAADRDGGLWIGTGQGLARWKNGVLTSYPELVDDIVASLLVDHEGTLWVGAKDTHVLSGKLCAFQSGAMKCFGGDGSFGVAVSSMAEDSSGALWLVGGGSGQIWRWRPGPPTPFAVPQPDGAFHAVAEYGDGILAVTRDGLVRISHDKVEPFPISPARAHNLLTDRDGTLWIGTEAGVRRLHEGRLDSFSRSDGLSGDYTLPIFEDREGNVWVSTLEGLDEFRPFAVTTFSSGQGFLPYITAVAASNNGGVWFTSTASGLHRWSNGRLVTYRSRPASRRVRESDRDAAGASSEIVVPGIPDGQASLHEDASGRLWIGSLKGLGYLQNRHFTAMPGIGPGTIGAITEDAQGRLWIADEKQGLLSVSDGKLVGRTEWANLGKGVGYRLAVDSSNRGVWVGLVDRGIAHVVDGKAIESFGGADGLAHGIINQILVNPDGALWVAATGGLSLVRGASITTLTSANGLPCDHVESLLEQGDVYWLYMGCGLVRIARAELEARASAPADRRRLVVLDVLGPSEGVRSTSGISTMTPHAAVSRDGKIWLVGYDGLTVVDPKHIHLNRLSPPVHIEQVTADRKTYVAGRDLHLPPLIRDLQIDYTAVSLATPEKVQFRYKLEGRDRDWQNPGNRRQAFYADLPSGKYRFRVIASNDSGVWNEQGDTLDFSIAPAYWQTNWFRGLCLMAFAALLWLAYWLRVRHLAHQFNRTLDARVAERTRIARDLHDTLLQSFHGLLLRFQLGISLLPSQPERAKKTLEEALDQAAEAMTEGRDAVQGLRASVSETNDLGRALRTFAEGLAADATTENLPAVTVVVEGEPRAVHPILRDEIYRIGCEALRNAFKHGASKNIETELRYGAQYLRLRIRDDGRGIDPAYLKEGRAGHFGLHGMRERAETVGGKLTVWSALDAGTEVELVLPANRAYGSVDIEPQPR